MPSRTSDCWTKLTSCTGRTLTSACGFENEDGESRRHPNRAYCTRSARVRVETGSSWIGTKRLRGCGSYVCTHHRRDWRCSYSSVFDLSDVLFDCSLRGVAVFGLVFWTSRTVCLASREFADWERC